LEGFDQMSAFWSMFWFKPFRNFLRKIAIFRKFYHWSEILSMSAGRPLIQGVCPPLVFIKLCVFLMAALNYAERSKKTTYISTDNIELAYLPTKAEHLHWPSGPE
jgi:hypothetical protein